MNRIDYKKITLEELAGLISEQLRQAELEAVLVGGACVSIYSKNEYMSYDLDFVTYGTMKEVEPVLKKIGFFKEGTRHFVNEESPYYIDFVAPPVAVGKDDNIENFNTRRTKQGDIKLFSPTDCVKDRLAAYYHWNDPQALDQALMVAQKQEIDLNEIKSWSACEGAAAKFSIFAQKIENNSKKSS